MKKKIKKIKKGKEKPAVGDTIVHREPSFSRTNEGKIIEMLTMQFVYETKSGGTRFCMFNEDWNHIEK